MTTDFVSHLPNERGFHKSGILVAVPQARGVARLEVRARQKENRNQERLRNVERGWLRFV